MRLPTVSFPPSASGERKTAYWPPLLVGLALAVVVLAPALNGGWLMILDTVSGPNPDFPRTFFGLDGGVTQLLPLLIHGLGNLIGPKAAAVVPFVLFFPVANVTMWNLLRSSSRLGCFGAGLFYSLTPIIFDRLWVGHSGYLLGYALLPLVLATTWSALERGGVAWARVAGAIALATACSPHFIWISLILLFGALVVRRPHIDLYAGAALSVMLAGLCTGYLLANSGTGGVAFTVDNRDIAAYASRPIEGWSLLPTLLSLRGFWRIDPDLPLNTFAGRPFLLAIGLLMLLAGVYSRLRGGSMSDGRRNVVGLGLSVLVALAVACGNQGPTASLYMWAFDHVPGFAIMREPQKCLAVLALVGAVLFGFGIDLLRERSTGHGGRVMVLLVAIVVPASLSPGIFWGYGNRLHGVDYPASWSAADRLIADRTADGGGKTLALPWHQYLSFDFTESRTVANPSPTFFRSPVISGDNAELPGLATSSTLRSSAYLSFLFSNGRSLTRFGSLVSPLDVRFVVLERSSDWRTYAWLRQQSDMTVVSDTPEIVVFENMSWKRDLQASKSPVVVSNWGALAAYANAGGDVSTAEVTDAAAGQISTEVTSVAQVPSSAAIRSDNSATSFTVSGSAGDRVTTDEVFDQRWSTNNGKIFQTPQGTVGVVLSDRSATLSFKAWPRYVAAYVIALCASAFTLWLCCFRFVTLRRRVSHASIGSEIA